MHGGWHRYTQQAMNGNAKAAKGRTEVVWANSELVGRIALFDVTA